MKKVFCDECGKFLFDTEKDIENKGGIGAEAQEKGFVYKNACLFSNKYSSLYFCDHKCGKSFYSKNIKPNSEITKAINELKQEVPKKSREIANRMNNLVRKLDEISSKR